MIRNLNVINSLFIKYNLKLFALYEGECNWAIRKWLGCMFCRINNNIQLLETIKLCKYSPCSSLFSINVLVNSKL